MSVCTANRITFNQSIQLLCAVCLRALPLLAFVFALILAPPTRGAETSLYDLSRQFAQLQTDQATAEQRLANYLKEASEAERLLQAQLEHERQRYTSLSTHYTGTDLTLRIDQETRVKLLWQDAPYVSQGDLDCVAQAGAFIPPLFESTWEKLDLRLRNADTSFEQAYAVLAAFEQILKWQKSWHLSTYQPSNNQEFDAIYAGISAGWAISPDRQHGLWFERRQNEILEQELTPKQTQAVAEMMELLQAKKPGRWLQLPLLHGKEIAKTLEITSYSPASKQQLPNIQPPAPLPEAPTFAQQAPLPPNPVYQPLPVDAAGSPAERLQQAITAQTEANQTFISDIQIWKAAQTSYQTKLKAHVELLIATNKQARNICDRRTIHIQDARKWLTDMQALRDQYRLDGIGFLSSLQESLYLPEYFNQHDNFATNQRYPNLQSPSSLLTAARSVLATRLHNQPIASEVRTTAGDIYKGEFRFISRWCRHRRSGD